MVSIYALCVLHAYVKAIGGRLACAGRLRACAAVRCMVWLCIFRIWGQGHASRIPRAGSLLMRKPDVVFVGFWVLDVIFSFFLLLLSFFILTFFLYDQMWVGVNHLSLPAVCPSTLFFSSYLCLSAHPSILQRFFFFFFGHLRASHPTE